MNDVRNQIATHECFGIIGQGSVSTIYDGYDHVLKREVAIKELRSEFRDDVNIVDAFWGEATLLAGLNHANILRVYGIDRELHWIIMEPMQGSLSSECSSTKLPASRVREILKQVLEGLRYLHSLDRSHGQICLESLLVDNQGIVKLSNLSESGNDDEFRCPDQKNLHCAPEILNPKHFGRPGHSADLYSVGIVALQLLAGDKFIKLFKGMDRKRQLDPIAWSAWHASSEPIGALQSVVSDVPSDLLALLVGLTQKQVGLRFATAAEAIGVISPQANFGTAIDGDCTHEQSSAEQLSVEGATVTYNSPNLFSPLSAKPIGKKAASWQTLLQEATNRFPQLRKPKVVLSIGGILVGFMLLAGIVLSANEQPRIQEAVAKVEQPIETESVQPIDFAYSFGNIDTESDGLSQIENGSVMLILSLEQRGPSLGDVEISINGQLQCVQIADSAANDAIETNENDTYAEASEQSDEESKIFSVVGSSPEGPITVTGPPGVFELKLRTLGYQPFQEAVTIVAGATEAHQINLAREIYTLELAVNPPTATLAVDGKRIVNQTGATRILPLPWGKHLFEFTDEGHKGSSFQMEVKSDQVKRVDLEAFQLVSKWIESFPNGADARIDGQYLGKTPFRWSGREGTHQIELSLAGYGPLSSRLDLLADSESDESRLCWYLERLGSSLASGTSLTKIER